MDPKQYQFNSKSNLINQNKDGEEDQRDKLLNSSSIFLEIKNYNNVIQIEAPQYFA
jgi:hypothetical protein